MFSLITGLFFAIALVLLVKRRAAAFALLVDLADLLLYRLDWIVAHTFDAARVS
jgi:hypothetical protein